MKPSVTERVFAVRRQYDLRDFVAQDLGLSRQRTRGRYIQVVCPFHADRDPSLAVYANNYYCHGCKAHGDIIDWVQHRAGVPFFEALESLEGVKGLWFNPLPVPTRPEVETTVGADRLRAALSMTITTAMYWMQSSPAQDYCLSRGWGVDTQIAYQLGYMDAHAEDLDGMGGKDCFEEMGLLYKSGHPWFSKRLLIPLFDELGHPVALATRTLPPGDEDGPRYINSRRSVLFRRDETIYGADVLPDEMDYFLIVEGYADVWSLHEVGVPAVAVMSDRMTDFQFEWIVKTARQHGARAVLAFDGDGAGQEGESLAYLRLAATDIPVSRLSLRDNLDMSDIVQKAGKIAVRRLLAHIEGSS